MTHTNNASYHADHAAAARPDTPLYNFAGAVAYNVVRHRYEDTGADKFLRLQWDSGAEYAAKNAADGLPAYCDMAITAAKTLATATTTAAAHCKAYGITGADRAAYIAAATSTQRRAAKTAANNVDIQLRRATQNATDFADLQSAAYIAALDFCGGVDTQDTLDAALHIVESLKPEIAAARATLETQKAAARAAGMQRLMDYTPYCAARATLSALQGRCINITVGQAARAYIGKQDHGGRIVYSPDYSTAPVVADAVAAAAKEDCYQTAMQDIAATLPDALLPVYDLIARDYTQTDIATALGITQGTVSKALAKIRAAVAAMPCYSDTTAARLFAATH